MKYFPFKCFNLQKNKPEGYTENYVQLNTQSILQGMQVVSLCADLKPEQCPVLGQSVWKQELSVWSNVPTCCQC